MGLELEGDNLLGYFNNWDNCLLEMRNVPTPDILETMF